MKRLWKNWRYRRYLKKQGADCLEIDRLARLPSGTSTETFFLGNQIHLPDVTAYLAQRQQILGEEGYCFATKSKTPRIIDCGANIGLATLYFLQNYPDAQIVTYEADPVIFKILESNLSAFLNNPRLSLNQAAVWTQSGSIPWRSWSSDSGRYDPSGMGETSVPSVRLRDLLDDFVDFLKIDIEGAEVDVLLDCKDQLSNVGALFVEYHRGVNDKDRLPLLLDILEKSGFRIFVKSEFCPKNPLTMYQEQDGFDHQLNIWARRSFPV